MNEEESKADKFASNILLNQRDYLQFKKAIIHRNDITEFANRNGVLPCFLGGLQHDEIIPYSYYNDLRVRYGWERKSTL